MSGKGSGKSKSGKAGYTFEEFYDDGRPVLTMYENGKKMSVTRMQEVFREYIRVHYGTLPDIRRPVPGPQIIIPL